METEKLLGMCFGLATECVQRTSAFEQKSKQFDSVDFRLRYGFYHKPNLDKEYYLLLNSTKGTLRPELEPVKIQLQYYGKHAHNKFAKIGWLGSDGLMPDLESILEDSHNLKVGLEQTTERLIKAGFTYLEGGKTYSQFYNDVLLYKAIDEKKSVKAGLKISMQEHSDNPKDPQGADRIVTVDARIDPYRKV